MQTQEIAPAAAVVVLPLDVSHAADLREKEKERREEKNRGLFIEAAQCKVRERKLFFFLTPEGEELRGWEHSPTVV